MNQLDFLGTVLYDFCKLNSLELQSADDILYSEFDNLTIHQRDWLSNYIQVWDNIVNEVEWLALLFLSNLSQNVLDVVDEVNTLCVLIVNLLARFIILVGVH